MLDSKGASETRDQIRQVRLRTQTVQCATARSRSDPIGVRRTESLGGDWCAAPNAGCSRIVVAAGASGQLPIGWRRRRSAHRASRGATSRCRYTLGLLLYQCYDQFSLPVLRRCRYGLSVRINHPSAPYSNNFLTLQHIVKSICVSPRQKRSKLNTIVFVVDNLTRVHLAIIDQLLGEHVPARL